MTEPKKIVAGDSVSWSRYEAGYLPADGWALEYRLVSLGQNQPIATVADGSEYKATIDSATTAQWAAGDYQLVPMMKRGATERVTLASQRVVVKPNPASGSYDPRSFAEKMLDALREQLAKKATTGKQSFAVEGQTVTYYSWDEMVKAEKYYAGKVSQQRRRRRDKRTGKNSNRVLTRMP
ncbi:hypothetical protein [Microbulbifer sp. ALW1]|uniref:hypothetical protein n=1 Tax=Microbulbifer sp. (strain ALW1) TaxID=1516059 RepID=UPI00135826DD|nr:hypothetical protein [Microbulbifer sp. ALW1]